MPRKVIVPALISLSLAACRHAPPLDHGASSFAVVRPPPAPSTGGTVSEAAPTGAQYRDAFLAGKPVLPVYPARALARKAGQAQVGVRVTIDTAGRVTDLSPSLFATSIIPPGFTEDFNEAVETAVRQWKFSPARIEQIEMVSAGGITYERVARSEKVEATLDLAFTFTANGQVQAGK